MLTIDDPRDVQTIVHALNVAAERFDYDARVMREANQIGLAEQFERQATDSREVAERLSEFIQAP